MVQLHGMNGGRMAVRLQSEKNRLQTQAVRLEVAFTMCANCYLTFLGPCLLICRIWVRGLH